MPPPDPSTDDTPLLDLALRWLPFGGPSPEDVFLQFGISAPRYWQRVAHAVESGTTPISDEQRAALVLFLTESGRQPGRPSSPLPPPDPDYDPDARYSGHA